MIHPDQNGFIQDRQQFHNICRVLNIINDKDRSRDNALLSMDLEKAFDRIEWQYLFEVLRKFGVKDNLLKWIRLLYSNPKADILSNGLFSVPFRLYRRTRQGCPLSPLLFSLAIEPLAIAICTHKKISGITLGDTDHWIALYADDIILFCSHLKETIPSLLHLINTFSMFCGYKINYDKSKILFVNDNDRRHPPIITPFLQSEHGFSYLGVRITPSVENIVT